MTRGWLTTKRTLAARARSAPSRWISVGGIIVLASLDCNASTTVVECERLRHYSCDCFGSCQIDDRPAVDSSNAQKCTDRLQQDFTTWQICASGTRPGGQRCDDACMLGWGACAFDVYRQAGLDPTNPCGGG